MIQGVGKAGYNPLYTYMYCKHKKDTCQNPASFSSGYKADCRRVHAGKRFSLEEEAVGTAPIHLIHGSGKTHLQAVTELRFMNQSDFYLSFLLKLLFQQNT